MHAAFEKLRTALTTAPIIRPPDWSQDFELMCDAFDYAIGAVLGQRIDGKPHVIYYSIKTLNEAQRNYTTTEKEILAIVYALNKFRPYLLGSKTVIFTDHAAIKFLLSKNETKQRLIRYILLLHEFHIEIRDKKGIENVVADHLSRLEIPEYSEVISENFPDELLFSVSNVPWFADIVNYLANNQIPST